MSAEPPKLRISDNTQESCGTCKHFYLLRFARPNNDGECLLHQKHRYDPCHVRSDFVCDDFLPTDPTITGARDEAGGSGTVAEAHKVQR